VQILNIVDYKIQKKDKDFFIKKNLKISKILQCKEKRQKFSKAFIIAEKFVERLDKTVAGRRKICEIWKSIIMKKLCNEKKTCKTKYKKEETKTLESAFVK